MLRINSAHAQFVYVPHACLKSENMAACFKSLSPAGVRDFLVDEIATISKDVLEIVVEHKIDGEVFLSLDDDLLREIAPLVGDRFKIKRLLTALLHKNISAVSLDHVKKTDHARIAHCALIVLNKRGCEYSSPSQPLSLTPSLRTTHSITLAPTRLL